MGLVRVEGRIGGVLFRIRLGCPTSSSSLIAQTRFVTGFLGPILPLDLIRGIFGGLKLLPGCPLNASVSLQVSSRLPKVKKQPLEAPAETLKPLPAERGAGPPNLPQMLPPLGPTPTAPSREGGSSKLGVLGHRERSSRPPSSALEDVEAFFMTQVCLQRMGMGLSPPQWLLPPRGGGCVAQGHQETALTPAGQDLVDFSF